MLPHSKGKPIKEPTDPCVKRWAFETLNQFNWICWISGTVGGCLLLFRLESALHNQTYTFTDERNIFWECSFSFCAIHLHYLDWVHSYAHVQSIKCIKVLDKILNKPFLMMQIILIFKCDNLLQVFLSNQNISNKTISWEYFFNEKQWIGFSCVLNITFQTSLMKNPLNQGYYS